MQQLVWPQIKYKAIKETYKQGTSCSIKVFTHQLCFIHMHQVLLMSVIVMTLISTSQASEELNYTPTWPSRPLLQSHTCAISHDADCNSLHITPVANWLLVSKTPQQRIQTQGRLSKLAWLILTGSTIWKPKAFHQLKIPHLSTVKDQQHKIVLNARHNLRAPSIHTCTRKQSNCNTSIWFVSDS